MKRRPFLTLAGALAVVGMDGRTGGGTRGS